LQLLMVGNQVAAGTPNAPTITGNGLTWVQVATKVSSTVTLRRVTVFRAMGTATTGTIVIDFAGQTQIRAGWSLAEFTGTDTSGTNGSGAIVQSASAEQTDAASSTGVTVTLAAFSNVNNATYGALRYGGSSTTDNVLEGTNFTRIGLVNGSASYDTEFAAGNQTAVNWTWNSTSFFSQAIGIEIAIAPPPPPTTGQVGSMGLNNLNDLSMMNLNNIL